MSKYCSGCSATVNDNAKYCPACGMAVHDASVSGETLQWENSKPREAMAQLKAYFDPMAEKYSRAIVLTGHIEALKVPDTGGEIIGSSLVFGIAAVVIGSVLIALGSIIAILGLIMWAYAAFQALRLISGIIKAANGNPAIVQYQNNLQILKAARNEVEAELQAHYDRYIGCPISIEYTAPPILNLLNECIVSGRADTIKEAIQCMLDDIHKAEMLELQKQTAENAKKAADSAQSAATSASLTTVMIAANNLKRRR